ncbi:MAG: hypothetical protein HC862_03305 [Scytonema sp. RU_4_4]|nr:hypothetical protein [Scytonema sp. RU_4_4]NJR73186.1 hypothetical protein [Scytonema sp. CRU_2_7]
MTQSVADNKTPIPDQARRRHTDPPGLWIAVATISITLHLLFFWLLRSYSYNLISRRSSSNPIPVDFVEISSQPKTPSKAKPVLSKRVSTTEKSSVAQGNLTPKSTSTVEDSNAIAFTNPDEARTSQPPVEDTTQQSSERQVIEPEETQPLPQPVATSEPTPEQAQPEPPLEPTPEVTPQAQQPQPIPEPTNLTDNPDPQNQANQELGEQNQVSNPENNTIDSTRPDSSGETGEQPKLPNESTGLPAPLPGQPDDQVILGKETPLPDLAPPVKPEQSPLDEQKEGGVALEAIWVIDTDAVKRDRQDNPPQIVGDINEKELDSLTLNRELGDQPVEFKAVLLIDSNGNLNSIILYPEPKIPEPQATQYKEYAEEIFKNQKFIPASSNNGNKPPLGELVVNIKIQRKSPNL